MFGQPCWCFGLSGASVRCTLLALGFALLAQVCSNKGYPVLFFVRARYGTKAVPHPRYISVQIINDF